METSSVPKSHPTQSANNNSETLVFNTRKEDHLIAMLAALAITIHIIESAFPSPLPGVKPGLANVITLITFFLYGWQIAFQVTLLRVLIASIILGTFLSPTFLLSLSGAMFSLVSLAVINFPFRHPWSKPYQPGPVSYSMISALSHMLGQFLVAWYFFIPHPGLFKLLPILMTIALLLGLVNGIISYFILKKHMKQNNKLNISIS